VERRLWPMACFSGETEPSPRRQATRWEVKYQNFSSGGSETGISAENSPHLYRRTSIRPVLNRLGIELKPMRRKICRKRAKLDRFRFLTLEKKIKTDLRGKELKSSVPGSVVVSNRIRIVSEWESKPIFAGNVGARATFGVYLRYRAFIVFDSRAQVSLRRLREPKQFGTRSRS